MFDDLIIPLEQKPRSRFISRTLLMIGAVGLIAIAIVQTQAGFGSQSVLKVSALEPEVRVRIVKEADPLRAVAPLVRFPLAQIAVDVAHSPVSIRSVRLLIDGVYDLHALESVVVTVDKVQAGYPVIPDSEGYVSFDFETLALDPGTHEIVFLVTTRPGGAVSALQAVFDPETALVFGSSSLRPQVKNVLAGTGDLVTLLAQGNVGFFVKKDGALRGVREGLWSSLYLYGEAEDFYLSGLSVATDGYLSSARLDIFLGESFLDSVPVLDGRATVVFPDGVVRVLRDKNTKLVLLLSELEESDGPPSFRMRLAELSAFGLTSRTDILLHPNLQLLPL